jgi:hypothetical protein
MQATTIDDTQMLLNTPTDKETLDIMAVLGATTRQLWGSGVITLHNLYCVEVAPKKTEQK